MTQVDGVSLAPVAGFMAVRRRTLQAGITLVELLIVLTIMAALTALAWPAINGLVGGDGDIIRGGEVEQVQEELVQDLRYVRDQAMTLGRDLEVTFKSGGWVVEGVDDGEFRLPGGSRFDNQPGRGMGAVTPSFADGSDKKSLTLTFNWYSGEVSAGGSSDAHLEITLDVSRSVCVYLDTGYVAAESCE